MRPSSAKPTTTTPSTHPFYPPENSTFSYHLSTTTHIHLPSTPAATPGRTDASRHNTWECFRKYFAGGRGEKETYKAETKRGCGRIGVSGRESLGGASAAVPLSERCETRYIFSEKHRKLQ